MKKLTKKQVEDRDAHVTALRSAKEKLTLAIGAFNEASETAFAEVSTAVETYNQKRKDELVAVTEAAEAYNEVAAEASSFCEGLRDEAQGYHDDKSEKWQEGDAGQAYAQWIEEIGLDVSMIELEEPDDLEVEEPAEVDEPSMEVGPDELEEMPGEPS